MRYNGWKNWKTWNVALWCDNDESVYKFRMAQKPKTAEQCEAFVREVWPHGTPDMTGDPYGSHEATDWEEIANHWKDDY